MAVAQNDKMNVNGIKSLNNSEYDDRNYNPKNGKEEHLHGRKPMKIRFFANGDKFFQGKKISVHQHKYQRIEDLLTELTNKMPQQVYLPNGIRQIFSPSSGRRITEIDQLENERSYVCAGNESFKSISYGINPRDPWFKGRPHHLSRYPKLLHFGLGSLQSINQNYDSNGHKKPDFQSNYAGQNVFPTRFNRPIGPAYISKNAVGNFSSIAYPKLIKLRAKGSHNQSSSYYQELLTQQVKPKVITVVKGGPETPKNFVRILLNKRSVQSYETLVTDIESSLRDQSQHKTSSINRIYNLFGKELKSVADFFKSDDFFIAIGDQDHLGTKQVKEILEDMYPDHPQTEQILQFWGVKKAEASLDKENIHYQEKANNVYGSVISVDKRDSGFEEQDFSKESEFTSTVNVSIEKELNTLPKPKLLKNKVNIGKKKKNILNAKVLNNSIQKVLESDSAVLENIPSRQSPSSYRKVVQERNAERLRGAYEEREKARLLIQEQMKAERKRIEDYSLNNNEVYSQYVRKSINEKGSIDVFKKMDEASLEMRKQKIRKKIEKQSLKGNINYANSDEQTNPVIGKRKEVDELPFIEHGLPASLLNTSFNNEIDETDSSQMKSLPVNLQSSPPLVRKLNQIAEVPNENNIEDRNTPANEVKEKSKNEIFDKSKKIENRTRRLSKSLQSLKQNKKSKEKEMITTQESLSQLEPVTIPQIDTNIYDEKENENVEPNEENTPDITTKKSTTISEDLQIPTVEFPNIKEQSNTESSDNKNVPPDIPKSESIKEVKVDTKIETKVPDNTSQLIPENDKIIENKTSNETPSSPLRKKLLQRQSSLPGNRVMGKLCRQISSSQAVYERFDISKVLGDGNFAVVKMVVRKESKKEYALKIIDKSKMKGKESMIENEIWIMKLCNQENIIKLKEEYETRDEVFLLMELIKGGDLFDAITQSVKFSEPVASKMVIDMANALFYLHSRRIVHRDLKPENLMVLRHRDGSITLKLADFGLAMEVKKLIYTVCGTPTYVAPEILTEQGYSLEVDLWALGVITYILLCGFPPFRSPKKDQDQLFEFIKSGNFEFISPYWDKISYDVKDLISRLLVVDRRLRYTTIQVLSHRWILSKGSSTAVSDEMKRGRYSELEEEAKINLEDFQVKKKEFRQAINREIQAAYSTKSK